MGNETLIAPNNDDTLAVGENITCLMYTAETPDEPVQISGTIKAVKGGGFYGHALLLDNECVIILAKPDAFH